LSAVLLAGCTALYLLPLAATRYFPGLDAPFHVLAVAAGDADLLYIAEGSRGWSYLTLYGVAGALQAVGFAAAVALQIVIALYVVAFAWGAARLMRAFDVHPGLALLALPAAFSAVMAYGFVPYAVAYPMTFFAWAFAREAMAGDAQRPGPVIGVALLSLLLAITHPLAAAFGAVGSGMVIVASADRARLARAVSVGAAIAVASVPAVVAVVQFGVADDTLPPLMRDASLWERWSAAPRPPLAESLGEAPARLVWLAPAASRGWLVALLLFAGAAAIAAGGRRPRSGFAAELLLAGLIGLYLLSPYTLEAPFVIAIQPRLLPLIWIAALLVLRVEPRPRRPRATAVPLVLASVAGAALFGVTMLSFAGEAGDFRAMVEASAPRAKTLALVEHAPAVANAPASPWRAFPVHLMVERGGYVSHAFFDAARWLPVRRADDAAPPRAPRPGHAREFDWARHAPGWDQFLIRDLDPTAPHDYFGGRVDQVELIVRAGRWRLYRRR
jgi:hypothetical protein